MWYKHTNNRVEGNAKKKKCSDNNKFSVDMVSVFHIFSLRTARRKKAWKSHFLSLSLACVPWKLALRKCMGVGDLWLLANLSQPLMSLAPRPHCNWWLSRSRLCRCWAWWAKKLWYDFHKLRHSVVLIQVNSVIWLNFSRDDPTRKVSWIKNSRCSWKLFCAIK